MNFCFVYKEDYPWDIRVEKIANTLAESGQSVSIVCKNANQNPSFEHSDKFDIYRLPKTNRIPRLLSLLVNSPLWFNPFWLYLITKVVIQKKSDALIIRDLPLMLSGIVIAKIFNRKVIFDMAECYPEMYQSAIQYDKTSFLNKLVKNPFAATIYEYICAKFCDHIFVMIEESKERLIKKGIDEKKITIVSNTPVLYGKPIRPKNHTGDQLKIVYVGFVTKLRGVDLLIQAVKKFIDNPAGGESIQVNIIGKGSAKKELESLVAELKLDNNVKIHGWLEHNEVKEIMESANVGALTYRFCGHWNHTIPNKIFDYMASGLPVLTTNVIPIARIINEVGCGLTTSECSIDQISENLIKLKNAGVRNDLGHKGQQAILHRFNWEKDAANMHQSLNYILSRK